MAPKKQQSNMRQLPSSSSPPPQPLSLPPFQPVPKPLIPLTQHLSRDKIYLVHLDRAPWEAKLYSFVIPLVGYSLIALGLLYRFFSVATTYPAMFLAFLANANASSNSDDSNNKLPPSRHVLAELSRMMLGMVFDYVLANTVWPILARYFFGGSIGYRRLVGFKNTEIIVRESGGGWGTEVAAGINRAMAEMREKGGANKSNGNGKNKGKNTSADSSASSSAATALPRTVESALKEIILPACDARLLAEKPGPMLINAHWMMNVSLSREAHLMLMKRQASYGDFSTAVLINSNAASGNSGSNQRQQQQVGHPSQWLIWHIDPPSSLSSSSSAVTGEDTDSESSKTNEAERAKILNIQRKLCDLGHEDLFFRWVETVQYESSHPEGFTPERQKKAMDETKKLFDDAGVDFSEFCQ